MRDPFGAQLAIAIQVAHTQFGEEAIASLHLSNGPLEQSHHFLDLGYHRRKQMGNTIIHDQFDHLRVNHQQTDIFGCGLAQNTGHDGINTHRLTCSRGPGDEQMRHTRQVTNADSACDVLAQGYGYL